MIAPFIFLTFLQPVKAEVASDDSKSIDFSGLPHDDKVFTRETIVEMNGIKYRKVEFQGKTYFMQLFGANATTDELRVLCKSPTKSSDALVRIGTRVTERTSFFVEGLRYACDNGGMTGDSEARIKLMSAVAVGFALDDKIPFLRSLKNKRITIFPGVGFSADAP